MEYREILRSSNYDFLKANELLNNNICLLAFGGSIAYGTNIETSDIDIRGIAINPTKQIFNLEKDFEQIVDVETDTVIYSINKMNKLLLSCNPNTLEILGCKPEHYIFVNKYGKMILNNKENYLSIKAIDSFGGYANQQYNRLEHGLLGNGENDDKKLQMLKHSLQRSLLVFSESHKDLNINIGLKLMTTEKIKEIYPDKEVVDKYSNEHLLVTSNFENIPVTDFKGLLSIIHNVQSEYGKINKRNTKKSDKSLAKHMMHLIRLYYMGIDLNTKCKITTYQEGKRHELLMDIRNQKYMYTDGMRVLPEFYDILHDIQKEYDYSLKYTVLPLTANYEAINNMMLTIYKDILK